MSFDDLLRNPDQRVPAAYGQQNSDWQAGGRPWSSALIPRKTTEPPEPLPFDPIQPPAAPGFALQEEEAKINKKGILADVANIGGQIHTDFSTYQNLLKEQGPMLIALKWRSEVFLNLLKELKKTGHLRLPAIRKEYEEIVQKYEAIHFKRTGHLASYVKNYLTEWVCPIAATARSAASRVHFIAAIQGKLKDRADAYYASYLGFRQSLGAFQDDLDKVRMQIDDIDGVIGSFTSKELPCDLKSFVSSVESDQEKLPENSHIAQRNELIVLLRNVLQPSAKAEEHMANLLGWGARLSQWLEEMPVNPAKKDGIFREETVENLGRAALLYREGNLSVLGANIQDQVGPLEQALAQLRTISRGLGLAEKLSPEVKIWAQAAAEGAVNYLESTLTRLRESGRTFYDLKTKADGRYAAICRSIDARKGESPATPATDSLRDAMEQAMQNHSAKGGSWRIWSFLSWRWRSTPTSGPKEVEERLEGLDVLRNRLAALDWVEAPKIAVQCTMEPIFADQATTQALLPQAAFLRDLQKVRPEDMRLEDYWQKAVRFWAQARALIQEAQAHNNAGAHLKATYELLKRFVEQLSAKNASSELKNFRPLLALSLVQLHHDCARHQARSQEFIKALNRHLTELETYHKKLSGFDSVVIRQVIQQLELIRAFLNGQMAMVDQTEEIGQWLSQNEQWLAGGGLFFYGNEDPFAAKPSERIPAASRVVSAAASIVLPAEGDEKPEGLGIRLQSRKWSQEPEQFLEKIDEKLPSLIKITREWELEKLDYHDRTFKSICGDIHRAEYQLQQLYANVQHLERAARDLATLYDTTPLKDKRTPLVQQLQLLKGFQAQLAKDAAFCQEKLLQSRALLEKMAREEGLKMTAEKINWRKQQLDYLTRTPEGNQRRLEQLQRSMAMYGFAAMRLQMLWDISMEAYKKAEERVEVLNFLQNAVPGRFLGYYSPAPLHANPFTKTGQAAAESSVNKQVNHNGN